MYDHNTKGATFGAREAPVNALATAGLIEADYAMTDAKNLLERVTAAGAGAFDANPVSPCRDPVAAGHVFDCECRGWL